MREIKFRGKEIKTGEWCYGYLYQMELSDVLATMILTTDNIHADDSLAPEYHLAFTLWVDLFPVETDTIGQYTGLHDKNGKEIYEGDVILHYASNGEPMEHQVYYLDKETRFATKLIGYDFLDEGELTQRWLDEVGFEVIGNIHDNPELLKNSI